MPIYVTEKMCHHWMKPTFWRAEEVLNGIGVEELTRVLTKWCSFGDLNEQAMPSTNNVSRGAVTNLAPKRETLPNFRNEMTQWWVGCYILKYLLVSMTSLHGVNLSHHTKILRHRSDSPRLHTEWGFWSSVNHPQMIYITNKIATPKIFDIVMW